MTRRTWALKSKFVEIGEGTLVWVNPEVLAQDGRKVDSTYAVEVIGKVCCQLEGVLITPASRPGDHR